MEVIQRHPGVVRSHASLWAQRDRKLFVSTEGSHLEFNLLAAVQETGYRNGRPAMVDLRAGRFNTPHLRTGYELVRDADWAREGARIARQAVEKVRAPAIDAGAV